MDLENEKVIARGLHGIFIDHSEITYIDGLSGILEYRGYPISELAENSTFEEVAYLILNNKLPNRQELSEFDKQLKVARQIPDEIYKIVEQIKTAHPMDQLRTAVSALANFDKDRFDETIDASYRKALRLTSQVPILVANNYRISKDMKIIEPDKELSHATNFIYMLKGKKPTKTVAKYVDLDMILHADHGINASSFTARVVTSTKADFYAAITAAIASLSGPAHGGAAEDVMAMLKEIGSIENADNYIKNSLADGKRITGFGHRVYKTPDPRAKHLKKGVEKISSEMNSTKWMEILEKIIEIMKPYGKKGIYPNVDYYAGVIYSLIGIPKELFVPMFAMGRVPGWSVQILEQLNNNILIRPLLSYTGKRKLTYIPIAQR